MKKLIMLAGPSGIGKTTIATDLTIKEGIPFRSGSISDLLPETQKLSHQEMLARDSKTLYTEDYQALGIRKKLAKTLMEDSDSDTVMDRSFLDNATYFWFKQVKNVPACEIEHFLNLCKMVNAQYCTHLIVVNFTEEMIDQWVTEDNDKRITSNYFQYEISNINKAILKLWGYKKLGYINRVPTHRVLGIQHYHYLENNEVGVIESLYGDVPVLILNTVDRANRIEVIKQFINGKKTSSIGVL